MRDFGGMVAFTLAGGEAAARAVAGRTRLFTLGESLGGVESLIGYPTLMSHAALVGTPQAIDPALLRLSVGIEDAADLVADLTQALDSCARADRGADCVAGVARRRRRCRCRARRHTSSSTTVADRALTSTSGMATRSGRRPRPPPGPPPPPRPSRPPALSLTVRWV